MKRIARSLALVLVIAAAAAGNTTFKVDLSSPVRVASVPGGGPIPMCNPNVEKCPNLR